MEITSINNDKVKYWAHLHEKKFRDQEQLFLVEGDHLVNEAIKNGLAKEIISLDDFTNELPTYKVTEEIMKKISSQQTISRVCAVCYKKKETTLGSKILCLDNIQDPGNLGTIIRTAVAFSFDTIILNDESVDLYNDKVIRSCEGMIFNINIIRCNLVDKLNDLKQLGYTLYTTSVKDNNQLKEIDFEKKLAIVLGNEGNGVSKEVSELCNNTLYIPMNNNCESLNVAIAASIIMYEVSR